ncbi:hypothetical protein CY34DRAFT_752483 [Suillus luteus UH-Slu-Lm8-n1]|uniref:Uncharacterized protein n=1 Tax=Suillus luteus UH-Slu-Lm8-n1 TaxID=930992 RepID=A0A0D0ALM4_9AGAM|nr:hypothetical protein CY34DRAFT_752483 [Suillus luteus UH-Slu-Lm8-n1]
MRQVVRPSLSTRTRCGWRKGRRLSALRWAVVNEPDLDVSQIRMDSSSVNNMAGETRE